MFMIQPIESCTRRIYKAGLNRLRAIGVRCQYIRGRWTGRT